MISPDQLSERKVEDYLLYVRDDLGVANTTQSMTRCDNLQARCPARPVSNRACSITAGEITLLRPASRSTMVSGSGVGSKQLPCRVIIIASLKPGSYTHPRLQEAMICARRTVLGLAREDVEYVLETFPIVRESDIERYGDYRTKLLILEHYDATISAPVSPR